MQTQRVFKPNGKTLVICDYREREVAKHLRELGAKVNMVNLEVADFVCGEHMAVERKSHSDFVSSIIDGRLFEQTIALAENYKKPIIIVEGYSNRNINPNAFYAAMATLMQSHVSVLWTKNIKETARAIFWISKKCQSNCVPNFDIGMKVGKKPRSTGQLQEFIVSSLPGVSRKISKRLLKEFGSVEAIFSAEEPELQKVEGIGKKLAKKIKDIASKKYTPKRKNN